MKEKIALLTGIAVGLIILFSSVGLPTEWITKVYGQLVVGILLGGIVGSLAAAAVKSVPAGLMTGVGVSVLYWIVYGFLRIVFSMNRVEQAWRVRRSWP